MSCSFKPLKHAQSVARDLSLSTSNERSLPSTAGMIASPAQEPDNSSLPGTDRCSEAQSAFLSSHTLLPFLGHHHL
ncbi:hypothetical protein BDW62DRAFT_175450 [Aspergillus aurantiobrunneus]